MKSHKTLASVVVIALVAGIPVTAAVLHKGFPISDVNLDTRDVWVTNGEKLLGGRLNHQIDELDAAVTAASSDLDVLQDGGGAYFLTDTKHGTIERIDQAYVSLVDRVQIPQNSQVSYGGDTLAILSPDGKLWVLDASNRLDFEPTKTKAAAKLGTDSQVVVSKTGTTFAVSARKRSLVTIEHAGASATTASFPAPKKFQLSAVGDTPVVLDTEKNALITGDGDVHDLPGRGIRLQQASEQNDYALVASETGLIEVPLGGGAARTVPADIDPVKKSSGVSAPVWLNGCAYGAWADAQRYLYACDGAKPVPVEIKQQVRGDDLRFRVNGNVIALNNVRDGNAWVVSANMQLVQNWATLKPNDTTVQGDTGKEKPVVQSFADTLAQRTKQNRPPTAVNDEFGVRAGRSTVLPVLANDTDPDGDVLTITDLSVIPEAQGTLDLVSGGRAVQFTPAKEVSGTISFRYTVDDGRGGTATAQVNAGVHPADQNAAPVSTRESSAQVEVGQTVTYNVLNDWIDPDGDDVSLTSAAATTEDDVQFQPNGTVTFTSKTGQTGSKEVRVTVSDGHLSETGSLMITVKPAGSLDPVATPDFATGFIGDDIVVHPLENDVSPSGDTLSLLGAELDSGPHAVVRADAARGTVQISPQEAGEYYLKYTIAAGPKSTVGLIRINATDGGTDAPPVAVTDTAYVRPGESTRVSVLDNDVSPSGSVLAVRSVNGGPETDQLNVELLDNAIVKITAPTVLTDQVQLTYVVSDGKNEATAGITVVPIPPLVNHQPPIAADDTVTVRAGDIVSVPVMANDYSPDDAPFTLDPVLKDESGKGDGATAFVSDKLVRYQAPQKAGQYSVVYSVTDKFEQKAQARVTFVVTADDEDGNRAPQPNALTVRAFAGSTVPVVVPLSGIDPDGDSVTLDGIVDQPSLGRIESSSTTGFTYQAYPGSAGTDTFTYRVVDTYGKSSTGTVRVGVIPRPSQVKPPIAVNDTVEVKPGKTASVPVLENDSDPNGYAISLKKKLPEVDEGLKAKVHGKIVLVTVPEKQGAYLVSYAISNGQGGQATAYIQVIVTEDAKPQYPTAIDHVIEPAEVAAKDSVKVDVLKGAVNPSGLASGLKVSVTGTNKDHASVGSGGIVTVRPGVSRMAISYALTDPSTGLAGEAFIVVPPRNTETAPPHIKNGLAQQIVEMNGNKSWKLSDVVAVPSGRAVSIVESKGVSASNGASQYQDGQTLSFTAAKDYRGPASVTFAVNDGHDDGKKKDRITSLVLPLTVGNPDQSDVPPTFTPPNITIEAGEAAKQVDLRASSFHPNPAILSSLTYTDKAGDTKDIQSTLSGSTLSVSAPLGVQPGASTTITFNVNAGKQTIKGSVNVKVVSSSRPLATQKNAPQTKEVKRGGTAALADATGDKYWVNPFPGKPMVITGATAASSPSGVTVTHTDDSITVSTTSGAEIGNVNVTYTVQDATKDKNRVVTGQYRVIIHDVPDKPGKPQAEAAGDSKAKVSFTAGRDNGKPIDNYEIFANGVSLLKTKSLTATVDIDNGKPYTFTVRAHNEDGWGAQSAVSNSVTTWGTPKKPGQPSMSASGYSPKGNLSWSWQSVDTRGGLKHYEWELNTGGSGTTTALHASTGGARSGQNYKVRVRAVNGGGVAGPWSDWSNAVSVSDPPPPDPSGTVVKGGNPPAGWGSCSTAWHFVGATYRDLPAGNYRLTPMVGGSQIGTDIITVHLSGSGKVSTHGCVGNQPSQSVSVRFDGPGVSFTATTNNWNGLSADPSVHP
jgi:hypothetical protein